MRRNCTNFVKHCLQCTLDYLGLLVDSANNIHEDVLLVCSGDVGAYFEGLATIYLEMHHSGPMSVLHGKCKQPLSLPFLTVHDESLGFGP